MTIAAATLAVLCVAALAPPPCSAAVPASGSGKTVYLGYLPEVSNWGAYEAKGWAYVDAGEGTARVSVEGLLADATLQYEAWLVPAEEREVMLSLGKFQVDETGRAEVTLSHEGLPEIEYRFLVITAEPLPDDDPAPDTRQALGGVFPNATAVGAGQPVSGLLDGAAEGGVGQSVAQDAGEGTVTAGERPLPLPVTGTDGQNEVAITPGALAVGALALTAVMSTFSQRLATRQVRVRRRKDAR